MPTHREQHDGDPDDPAEGTTDQRPQGGGGPGTSPRQGHSGSDVPPSWLRTSAMVVGALLLIALLVLVAATTLPSWWASTVGRQVDGVAAAGILWGLAYGVVFTLVPLVLVMLAVRARWHWKIRLGIGIGALLVLLPNLLTLAVSLGATENTRAARTVLAVQAPNFRGATLIGVLGTAMLGAGVALLVYRMTASRRELAALRQQARED